MKKFSPNITDGELQELFREAAENYEPLDTQRDKDELWERIRSTDRDLYPRCNKKKILSWLPSLLAILFLGVSLPVGDSFLQMGKWHAFGEPERTWNKGIGDPLNGRSVKDRRSGGDENTGISRPVGSPDPAEVEKGRFGPKDRRDSLEVGKDEQGRAEVPGGKSGEQEKEEASVAPKARSRNDRKRWSIGVTLGTDWSMVKNDGNERPGLDWGVMAGYRFARRWSVESGFSVESKIYSTSPKDYHSGVSYPGLVSVDARCRVFDLPINVRYDVVQRGNSRLFVSAGLSSFWMQKEDYTYNITTNGSPWISKTTIYNKNRYFLSIIDLGLGYEYVWNKFAIQASPYLKFPLTGIGYGKVDLKSTGLFLTLKRRL